MGRTCSIGEKLIDFRMVHRAEIRPVLTLEMFFNVVNVKILSK